MKTRKEIMTEAHQIAKTFEGDYVVCLSEALKIVWKIHNNEKNLNVKEIYESIYYGHSLSNSYLWDNDADYILSEVANKSKGFQSDIAKRVLETGRISEKQTWCIAYEYKNIA